MKETALRDSDFQFLSYILQTVYNKPGQTLVKLDMFDAGLTTKIPRFIFEENYSEDSLRKAGKGGSTTAGEIYLRTRRRLLSRGPILFR